MSPASGRRAAGRESNEEKEKAFDVLAGVEDMAQDAGEDDVQLGVEEPEARRTPVSVDVTRTIDVGVGKGRAGRRRVDGELGSRGEREKSAPVQCRPLPCVRVLKTLPKKAGGAVPLCSARVLCGLARQEYICPHVLCAPLVRMHAAECVARIVLGATRRTCGCVPGEVRMWTTR